MTKSSRLFFAGSLMSIGVALAAGSSDVSAVCTPAAVSATDFIVNGEVDLNAYLAAVQSANAACSPNLPATGSESSSLLPIAIGLAAVGGSVAVTARRRAIKL